MESTSRVPRDFTPRYYSIEQALRGRIAGLRPNDPLPSEAELCEEFSVSRMTARSAVSRLVTDGLVYRQSGRGTFVAAQRTNRRADNLVRFSDEMLRQGRRPTSRLVSAELREPSTKERDRLRLGRAREVVAIVRLRLADDIPVALEYAVFPAALAPLLNADLVDGSLHEALIKLGRIPSSGQASLVARNATAQDSDLLGIGIGAALLVEQRLILDQSEQPLELTESLYVGDRYALDVNFDVERPNENR